MLSSLVHTTLIATLIILFPGIPHSHPCLTPPPPQPLSLFLLGVKRHSHPPHPHTHSSSLSLPLLPSHSDVLQGLDYLHYNHIMHGDLKPENLLLSLDDVVKISDFGSCSTLHPAATISSTLGTPAFMAPEMCQLPAQRFRPFVAEMWALGVCLYMFMFGRGGLWREARWGWAGERGWQEEVAKMMHRWRQGWQDGSGFLEGFSNNKRQQTYKLGLGWLEYRVERAALIVMLRRPLQRVPSLIITPCPACGTCCACCCHVDTHPCSAV